MAANAATLREINEVIQKMERSVTAFDKRDRRKMLTPAAAVVRKNMRNRVKRGTRVRTRRSGSNTITYYPGNLRKSIKRLNLRRTLDLFVGPFFGFRQGVVEYGKTAQNVDPYYFAAAYGSKQSYINAVVNPTLLQSAPEAIRAMRKRFIKLFGTRAAQQGLSTR